MEEDMREMTRGELAAMCTNLQKACTKQMRSEEALLFGELASFYEQGREKPEGQAYQDLLSAINEDLAGGYKQADSVASANKDRGSLRALVWGEKVSKLLKSLLLRYEKQKNTLLENTNVYVCEICGFVYVGEQPPAICPICKVPSFKIQAVQKEAI
ncbi:MAG: rubredoxin [Spirochaetia bacterium]|nr:rubredoxin [Spirochaetia bacterium]